MQLAILTALVAAPTALAQEPYAASEAHVLVAPTVVPGGADAQSASYVARVRIGDRFVGALASPSYDLTLGTLDVPAALPKKTPAVLGVVPPVAVAAGGDTVRVIGFGLDDMTGTADVQLGAAPPVVATTLSSNELELVLPPGVNAFANPLGLVDAQVDLAYGSAARDDAFVFAPALVETDAPSPGGGLSVDLHASAGAFYQVALGGSVGVGVPIPPFAGALEVLTQPRPITPFAVAPADTVALFFPTPDDPSWIGLQAELQAVVVTSLAPLAGSFTNRLVTTVVP